MSARLILRPASVRDKEDQATSLARRSPATADRFVVSCMADFQPLAEMPGMGSVRDFHNPKAAGIRSWPLSGFLNYLVFYRPIEDGIEVLRILHGARDIDSFFE